MLKRLKIVLELRRFLHRKRMEMDQVRKISDSSYLMAWIDEERVLQDQRIDCLIKSLTSKLKVIKIGSTGVMLWNFLVFCSIFYYFLLSLFQIFILSMIQADREIQRQVNHDVLYVIVLVFLIDMIFVRWRIQSFACAEIVKSSSQLLKNYVGYYFLIDLLALIILILELSNLNLGLFKVGIYLKAFIFQQIKVQLNLSLKGSAGLQIAFKATRLLFFVIFWSFFFSCIFVSIELHYISEGGFYFQNGFLWLTSSPSLDYVNLYQKFDWLVWFEYALFFVMQMVRGCGLGVPAPRCPLSMLWYNISNITMTALFLYFTDKVISVISKFTARNQLVQNLINLKQMRQIIFICFEDYKKYRKFLQTAAQSDIKWVFLQTKLQGMIKGNLLKELNYGMKQHFTLRFRLLKSIISDTWSQQLFKRELANSLKSYVVYRGQIIYRKYEISASRLYLSETSQFIVSNDSIEYTERLSQWSFAGIRQFFIDQKPLFDVIATQIATVEYIEKQKFISAAKICPRIYDSYCQRIDSILIERQSTECLELRCWHCQDYHLNEDCPRVAFDKDKFVQSLLFKDSDSPLENHLTLSRVPFDRAATWSKKLKQVKKGSIDIDRYRCRDFSYVEYNIDQIGEIIQLMSSDSGANTSFQGNYAEVGEAESVYPLTP